MTTKYTNEQLMEHLGIRLDATRTAAKENAGTGWAEFYEKEVAVLEVALTMFTAEPVADVVAWKKQGEERTCDIRWRRHDVAPGTLFTAPPATADETRQIRDLVMMVKLLARTVKKYNPVSTQAKGFLAYLEREGLISIDDILRDRAKDPE